MVSDTLQIAICGDMPDMTGRLACREDIRYCLFLDSWALRERLLDWIQRAEGTRPLITG